MESIPFIRQNKKFLVFGLLLTLFSTFGQTSFLSVFTPTLKEKFSISNKEIGFIYFLATLASACTLSFTGKWIDSTDLRRFTFFVCVLLIGGCLSMALASSVIMLFLAYFILRLAGQGLFSHTSMVSMARYFSDNRGLALSLASLGYPLGDALFPLMAIAALTQLGFSQTWWWLLLSTVCFIIPTCLLLLRGHETRHAAYLDDLEEETKNAPSTHPNALFKDTTFFMVVFGVLAPGFINTGLFFQNAALLQCKGWPLYLYAGSLVYYATGNILGSFLFGQLIDRLRVVKVMAFFLVPMAVGLFCVYAFNSPQMFIVLMLGQGITQGGSSVIVGAVWTELYGSEHIGTIRSHVSTIKVLFTAISPVLFGALLDRGVAFTSILLGCIGYTIVCSISLFTVSIKRKRAPRAI